MSVYPANMETIKRYGVKMGDLSDDAALVRTAAAGRAVPEKFLETPGRQWLKRMVRVTGLFSFVLTVLSLGGLFIGGLFQISGMEVVGEVLLTMLVGLLFVNHFGLFLEMAGDSSGKNWFAKGAGLMWLSLFGSVLIGIAVRVVTSLF